MKLKTLFGLTLNLALVVGFTTTVACYAARLNEPALVVEPVTGYAALPSTKTRVPVEWLGDVQRAASRHGVPFDLLAALLQRESAWNPQAVSRVGAKGLGQFMPRTAAAYGVNVTDPKSSIDGAARYLRDLKDQFGSWPLATAAYNCGPGCIESWRAGKRSLPVETINYVAALTEKDVEAYRGRVQVASN